MTTLYDAIRDNLVALPTFALFINGNSADTNGLSDRIFDEQAVQSITDEQLQTYKKYAVVTDGGGSSISPTSPILQSNFEVSFYQHEEWYDSEPDEQMKQRLKDFITQINNLMIEWSNSNLRYLCIIGLGRNEPIALERSMGVTEQLTPETEKVLSEGRFRLTISLSLGAR